MTLLTLTLTMASETTVPEESITEPKTEVVVSRTHGKAQTESFGSRYTSLGNRLDADGVGIGVGVSETVVMGTDGGVFATTTSIRYANTDWIFSTHLAVATYRTQGLRNTGLGNLRLEGFHRWDQGKVLHLAGVEIHLPTGQAWTYTNDSSSLWPGGGFTGVYQRRQSMDSFDLLFRGSLGLHGTPGVAPFPKLFVHAAMSVGIDADLPADGVGTTAELSFSVWDPSPIDAAGWFRVEPVDGLRIRAGVLLPLGSWVGLSPGTKPGGLREGSIMVDLSLAL